MSLLKKDRSDQIEANEGKERERILYAREHHYPWNFVGLFVSFLASDQRP